MPVVPAVALWVGLCIVIYFGVLVIRRLPVTIVPFAAFILTGWLVLDARWQWSLWNQLESTEAQFSGKDWQEKRLAGEDGGLFQFILEIKSLLPAEPARIFIISADPFEGTRYLRSRARYHLLPHNVFPLLSSLPTHAQPGDYLLVFPPCRISNTTASPTCSAISTTASRRNSCIRQRQAHCSSAGSPSMTSLILAIVLPWAMGVIWLRKSRLSQWPLLLSYSYLLGILLSTLLLRAVDSLGLALNFPLIAGLLSGLIVVGILQRGRFGNGVARSPHGGNSWQNLLFGLVLAGIAVKFYIFAVEIGLRPVYPWDAWTTWGVRPQVWFEFKRLVPFVDSATWLATDPSQTTVYLLEAWHYPPAVSLIQL
ncbi:MAG: hypothetical protein R3F37_10750 [Candidatus Competibacteraceae bacterium]